MAGKNQVIVKDNRGHETKVHRRDLKVIDSDTNVTEMYGELRKEGKRDTQHCMPVKQIPDLNWEKENLGKENTERDTKTEIENRTGPTLRSSKKNVNEIKEKVEATPNKNKEEICADFISVAGTVIAAGVYTVVSQFINSLIFLITDSPDAHHMKEIQKNITHQTKTDSNKQLKIVKYYNPLLSFKTPQHFYF